MKLEKQEYHTVGTTDMICRQQISAYFFIGTDLSMGFICCL